MKKNILYILPLIALAGCASNEITDNQREPVIVGDQEIVLTSGVGTVSSTNTRAVINSTLPTGGLDVKILRLDVTGETSTFPDWNTAGTVPTDVKSAHVDATTQQVAFNDGATPTPVETHEYYQANGNKTRLQGWYPNDGALAAGKITWTIKGDNDIMISNYQDGSKTSGDRFGENKVLTFEHLLTQIKVKAYAENAAALAAWGGIEHISIKDFNPTCEVTLGDITTSAAEELTTTFSGKKAGTNLYIIPKSTDDQTVIAYDAAKGLEYDTTGDKGEATPCGYAMFQPGAASAVTLAIKTKKGGTIDKTLTVELKHGTAYNVTLKFTSTEIVPEVAITNWLPGDDIDVEL